MNAVAPATVIRKTGPAVARGTMTVAMLRGFCSQTLTTAPPRSSSRRVAPNHAAAFALVPPQASAGSGRGQRGSDDDDVWVDKQERAFVAWINAHIEEGTRIPAHVPAATHYAEAVVNAARTSTLAILAKLEPVRGVERRTPIPSGFAALLMLPYGTGRRTLPPSTSPCAMTSTLLQTWPSAIASSRWSAALPLERSACPALPADHEVCCPPLTRPTDARLPPGVATSGPEGRLWASRGASDRPAQPRHLCQHGAPHIRSAVRFLTSD